MNDLSQHPATDQHVSQKVARWRLALMLGLPVLMLVAGLIYWMLSGRTQSTDNAYVGADKISVTSDVSGLVVETLVRENQLVRKGDLLFRLDPVPFQIALAEAQADLETARTQVREMRADLQARSSDIAGARDSVRYAQSQLARQKALLQQGFTTKARYDEAVLALQKAQADYDVALADSQKVRAQLAGKGQSAIDSHPKVLAAKAARDRAAYNLEHAYVRAPATGKVAQASRLQVGQMLIAGVPVVSIVYADGHWVDANFKETQLTHMRVGQPVDVRIDAYPDLALTGHVASIGAGTGAQFSVLPAQNANGNWVKVVQRVPVRIALDKHDDPRLIAGLSAQVDVRVRP